MRRPVEGIAVLDSLASVAGLGLAGASARSPFRPDSRRRIAGSASTRVAGLGRTAGSGRIGLGHTAVAGAGIAVVDILGFHRRSRTGSSLGVVRRNLAVDTAGSLD